MASNSLTLYKDASTTFVFTLVSASKDGATYQVAGRDLATPLQLSIVKKLTNPSATANDHIQIRVSRVERNTTNGKLATMSASLDLSIPKDTSVISQTPQKEIVACLCSLLRDYTANAATNTAITALIGGFDL